MLVFMLLAATITVSSMISTVISVHLLSILRAQDIALAAAVALGALVGPSQVGARAIEMLIGRYHHPIWTMVASTLFVAIGVGALWGGLPIISAALVFYGAGIGIESIARGTLPLALFGVDRYAAIMGRIAMPSLVAQAVSPSLSVLLMERSGASGTLAALFAFAILDVCWCSHYSPYCRGGQCWLPLDEDGGPCVRWRVTRRSSRQPDRSGFSSIDCASDGLQSAPGRRWSECSGNRRNRPLILQSTSTAIRVVRKSLKYRTERV